MATFCFWNWTRSFEECDSTRQRNGISGSNRLYVLHTTIASGGHVSTIGCHMPTGAVFTTNAHVSAAGLCHVLAYAQFSWPKYTYDGWLSRVHLGAVWTAKLFFVAASFFIDVLRLCFFFLISVSPFHFHCFLCFNFFTSFLMFIVWPIIYINLHSSTLFTIVLHFFSVPFTFVSLAVLLSTCSPSIYLLFSITLLAFRSYLYSLL
jgi:hypothetical protein